MDETQGGKVFSDPAGAGFTPVLSLSGQRAGLTSSGGVIRDTPFKAPDRTALRLNLSAVQTSQIVVFLKTLTDSTFLTSLRFANPFVSTIVSPVPALVTIQSNSYPPPTLTVAPGTVITFTNIDNSRQSAQFDSPQIASPPIFSCGAQTVTVPSGTGTYSCTVQFMGCRCRERWWSGKREATNPDSCVARAGP